MTRRDAFSSGLESQTGSEWELRSGGNRAAPALQETVTVQQWLWEEPRPLLQLVAPEPALPCLSLPSAGMPGPESLFLLMERLLPSVESPQSHMHLPALQLLQATWKHLNGAVEKVMCRLILSQLWVFILT